jgi:DHA1 family tetracycline resistance protein-like MFS transporter
MFGFSKTGLLFWFGIPFLNLMSFAWPAAQSILSQKTSPSEQGQLQGAINGLRGIAGLVGPGLFTYIFSKSIGAGAILHLPGSPFYAASTMLLLALFLAQRAAGAPPPNQ